MRQRRLQWQLLFSVVAALCVTTLSILLIVDAVRTADRIVVADARRMLSGALDELTRQYRDRVAGDPGWTWLPPEAREVSLEAVARIVFRAYPGVEGGYRQAEAPGAPQTSVAREGRDLVVIEARRLGPREPVAWASKRLTGRNDPWVGQRQILLAALALAGLISVGGVIAAGIRLHQGIREIQRGLKTLEHDFGYSLPTHNDELGEISGSINRMAAARRALEAEVAREQRLRTIGRLVAGVAHEIRNPLNGIRLSMDMFERRLARNALQREDIRMVRDEVDRLNHLLTDLLTFEQPRQPQQNCQPVEPVVQRCLQLLKAQADERGVQLAIANPGGSIEGRFDARRLMQAVMNLALNAIQATQPGGAVEIAITRAFEGVRLTVQDPGPGLTEEQKDHLFEAFYTTKSNGTGLGLAVSRELVSSMGGELTYEDANPGARFLIYLPAGTAEHG